MKKVVQSGDTACLQPTLDIFHHKDRQLLQAHCHTQALAILHTPPTGAEDPARTREAIAYLSLAIFTAGGCFSPGHPACPTQPDSALLGWRPGGTKTSLMWEEVYAQSHQCPGEHTESWEQV